MENFTSPTSEVRRQETRRIGSLNKVMIVIKKRDLLLNLTPFKASDIKLREGLLDQFLRRLNTGNRLEGTALPFNGENSFIC